MPYSNGKVSVFPDSVVILRGSASSPKWKKQFILSRFHTTAWRNKPYRHLLMPSLMTASLDLVKVTSFLSKPLTYFSLSVATASFIAKYNFSSNKASFIARNEV